MRLATVVNSILQARGRTSAGIGLALALAAIIALAQVSAARAAAVRPIDPPSGAALIERPVTLRWGLDVSDCAPNKTAVTQVQVEIDGQLGPAYLPEPADTGLNAGLFAAAAGDGFRFTVSAVNLKTDGTPSVYRWRAFVDCTGPGIPPDPTAVPIHVEGPWSEFRVTRVSSSPGTTPTPGPTPGATPAPVRKTPAKKRSVKKRLPDCFVPNAYGVSALDRRIYLAVADDERRAAEFWEELSNNLDPLTWIWRQDANLATQYTQLDPAAQLELGGFLDQAAQAAGLPVAANRVETIGQFVSAFDDGVVSARAREEALTKQFAERVDELRMLENRLTSIRLRLTSNERLLNKARPGSREAAVLKEVARRLRGEEDRVIPLVTAASKVKNLATLELRGAREALERALALRTQALGRLATALPPGVLGPAARLALKGLNVLAAAQLAAKGAMISTALASAALREYAKPPKGCPAETPARLDARGSAAGTTQGPSSVVVGAAVSPERSPLAALDQPAHASFAALTDNVAEQSARALALHRLTQRRATPTTLARMSAQATRLAALRARFPVLRRAAAAQIELPGIVVTAPALTAVPLTRAADDLPTARPRDPVVQRLLGTLPGNRAAPGESVDPASLLAAGPSSGGASAATFRRLATTLHRSAVTGCGRLARGARAACLRGVARP